MPLKMISPSVLPADAIQDTEVDWGTGADQVNASDIPDEGTSAAHKVIITKAEKDKIHTQGTDTALGTQAENLDMGGFSIDDMNVANLKAISCAIHNNTGATLVAGVGVYPTGESGGIVTVAKCDNTDKDKMPCLGIISTDIADGDAGKVVRCGIKSMNTSGFAGNVGDRVYIQSDGTLDTTEPTSGSIQRVGILVVKDASGKIYVHFRGRKSINASADEHPIVRMGNDVGHQKVSFHKYDNTEIGYIDKDAIMKIVSLTDGTDSATVANLKDAVDKKHTQPMTTAGDIIVGGASGVAARLAKGSDTEVLTLASGTPSWAAPAGGTANFTERYRRFCLQDSIDGYTKTADGGCDAVHKGSVIEHTTSGNLNDRACLVSTNTFENLVDTAKTITAEWIIRYTNNASNFDAELILSSQPTPFHATPYSFGFHIDYSGNINAKNRIDSGATETDTGINLASGAQCLRLRVVFVRGTDCKFYVNDVLRATHDTNLPETSTWHLHQCIKNIQNATAKTIRFDRVFIESEY